MTLEKGKYYLKKELIEICKEHNIPYSNLSKIEIEERIKYFQDFGKTLEAKKFQSNDTNFIPSIEKIIPLSYKNDLKNREFFKSYIKGFKYNIRFLEFIKHAKGIKTYKDAIDFYIETKNVKNEIIAPQFKYNNYIRDFLKANQHLSKSDAIKCWNSKKLIMGDHKYESSDLGFLTPL